MCLLLALAQCAIKEPSVLVQYGLVLGVLKPEIPGMPRPRPMFLRIHLYATLQRGSKPFRLVQGQIPPYSSLLQVTPGRPIADQYRTPRDQGLKNNVPVVLAKRRKKE